VRGKIIVFRLLKRVGHVKVNKFCRRFYGYLDRSNRGKYTYRRLGFIDGIPHVRVIRGVVIVRTEDAGKVVNFLKGFGAEIYAWTVVLRPEDEKALARFRPKSARPTGVSLTSP
jgi:hypothetical protein